MSRMLSASPRRLGVVAWFVALLSLITARPAAAQFGGPDQTPKPISTQKVNEYAERLGLTDVQRRALDQLHDTYKQSYRNTIDPAVQKNRERERELDTGGMIPTRDAIAEMVDAQEDIMRLASRTDESFFDSLAPLLTGEQQAMLPRVRLARARERFSRQGMAAQMFGMGAPVVDLSALVYEIRDDLAPEEFQAADAILASYETRLTSQQAKMYQRSTTAMLEMFDQIESEFGSLGGMSEEAIEEDPEFMEAIQRSAMTSMMAIMKEAGELAAKSTAFNSATLRQIRDVIPPEVGDELNRTFLAATNPQAAQILRSEVVGQLDRAQHDADLDDAARASIADAYLTLRRTLDSVAERIVKLTNEQMSRAMQLSMMMGEGSDPDAQAELEKLAEAMSKQQELAMSATTDGARILSEIYGTEMPDEIRFEIVMDSAPVAMPAQALEDLHSSHNAVDEFTIGAIRNGFVTRLVRQLDVESATQSLVTEMHREYVETYRNVDVATKLGEAIGARWNWDPSTQMSDAASDEQMRQIEVLRDAVIESYAALDAQFFADLRLILDLDDERTRILDRSEQLRRRDALNAARHFHSYTSYTPDSRPPIDVVALTMKEFGDRETLASIDSILQAYEASVTPLLKSRFDLQREISARQNKWQNDSMRHRADNPEDARDVSRRWQTFNDEMKPLTTRLNQINNDVNALNDRTIDELARALADRRGSKLRRTYDRLSYPTVYADAIALHDALDRMLENPTLTPDQRSRLVELSAEYNSRYEALSQEAIAIERNAVNMGDDGEYDWQAMQDRQNEIARVQFDRAELSHRTANELRRLLTEEQLISTGGLPNMEEEPERIWW